MKKTLVSTLTEQLLISQAEAAAMLGITVRRLAALTHRGEIPARRIGNQWHYSPARLREWSQSAEEVACVGK
jgi:excisionase family DNA binding protein